MSLEAAMGQGSNPDLWWEEELEYVVSMVLMSLYLICGLAIGTVVGAVNL